MRIGRRKRTINTVLVVEDEPLVAFDTEYLLGDAGYRVVATVDRVTDAVAVVTNGSAPDLVLVDVRLADGSGLEVARAAHGRGIAVIFVTGQCPSEGRTLADGCLAKPYAARDLLAAIDALDGVRQGVAPKRLPAGFSLFAETA